MPFECDKCGACCDGSVKTIAALSDARREPRLRPYIRVVDFSRVYLTRTWDGKERRCPFLRFEDNCCDIYETRPAGCRSMPVGGEDCQRARRLRGIPELKESA